MYRPNLPLHIDSTMITCARQCLQKFGREFCEGYRPAAYSVDLHAGACFATAIEVIYKAFWRDHKSLPDALALGHAAFFSEWGDFEIPEWKKTAKRPDRMWEAIEDYFMVYPPQTDHIQPFIAANGEPTFEYTFAIPLEPTHTHRLNDGCFPTHPSGQPFVYSGRFDMLGYHAHSGRPIPLDHKTTGSIGQNWAEGWDLRNQFLGYVWACRQCGLDVDSVMVRGIAIQVKEIKHAEALKLYTNELLDRWHEQLRRDLWRIRKAHDEGYFDYNFGDACTAYGHCAFMPVCVSGQPESWLSNYVVRKWNPLLKNPIADQRLAA